nr:hypothetical protein [Tanacetum cinerariifolium]
MTLETHNWSSSAHQELHKIVKDKNFPIVNQVDARVQNFEIQFLKEAAEFVGDFKSLAKEADESIAKHRALELEIEHILRAVVSRDIISIMQNNFVDETSNLQTELERTKERFKNCIIKKENEYAKLRNDWYKKCEECKFDKISYNKAYNDMQQKIEQLQAQLEDLKGKIKDTSCVSDTLNPLSNKLENENVELEFQDTTRGTSANTKFAKQSILGKPPKVGESHALSKPVTSNSIPTPQGSKVVKNDKHKILELEIEHLLKAVVTQDIISVVQNASVVDTSDLQTELERTKERFENCIIKKETEYAKLWNDWYKKCENMHLKATYKNLFDSISVLRVQTETKNASLQNELQSNIYKNAKLRTQLFKKVSDQKENTQDSSKNTKFAKQPNVEILPKIGETNALSKPVTSNSVSTPPVSKGVSNDKVITPGMFRISPDKISREAKKMPNTVNASAITKPTIVLRPSVINKKEVNSDLNGLSSIGVDNTTKTRRTQLKCSSKNNKVPYVVKSSYKKNKAADVEENHRNLLSSSNKKHVSASAITKPTTVLRPSVINKKEVNSDLNGLSSIGVDNTTKTRRTQLKRSSKNNKVPYVVKSSYKKNKAADVEENHRNLLSSSNKKHQAPRAWYAELSTFLLQNHFFKGTIDPTLFIRRFVDDILVSNYVLEILKKYGMESCDPVGTPMEIKDKLDLDQNRTPVDATKYRSMIGALMYLTSSRLDIVHATCLCARYQDSGFELTRSSDADYAGCKDTFKSTSGGAQFLGEKLVKPTEKHLKEVKRIFRYLRGNVNTGLWYTKDSGFELTRSSDADYAGCKDTFKSTSGGAQFLVLWMWTQLTDYGFHFNKIPIYCDSKSAIAISCNRSNTQEQNTSLSATIHKGTRRKGLSPQELDRLAQSQ